MRFGIVYKATIGNGLRPKRFPTLWRVLGLKLMALCRQFATYIFEVGSHAEPSFCQISPNISEYAPFAKLTGFHHALDQTVFQNQLMIERAGNVQRNKGQQNNF